MTEQLVYAEGLVSEFGDQSRFLDVVDLASPAAGANASLLVTGDSALRVLAATATLTTSAAVANRFLALDYLNSRGSTYVRNAAGLVVTASTTNQAFHWSYRRGVAEWASNTPVFVPLLDYFLLPGWTVRFTVDNIDAGDQLSAVRLVVARYLTGGPSRSPLES